MATSAKSRRQHGNRFDLTALGKIRQGAEQKTDGECYLFREDSTMQERVKVFTFVSGHGETVVEPSHS